MLGGRDLCWSLGICAALILFSHCRPSWSARRFLERESRMGFIQVFPERASSSVELAIEAEQLDWRGERAEFVLRHVVQLEGRDASWDIHLRLEQRAGRWVYTLFEVRGQPPFDDPDRENPFARALREAGPG